jgi:hypothetical protein
MMLEKEKEDLDRRLNDEKEAASEAKTDAENARAAARKLVADLELEVRNMRAYDKKVESDARAGVDRPHTLYVNAYRDFSTQTSPFDKSGEEVGTRFLGWMQRS